MAHPLITNTINASTVTEKNALQLKTNIKSLHGNHQFVDHIPANTSQPNSIICYLINDIIVS